jgi:hypothetical protein
MRGYSGVTTVICDGLNEGGQNEQKHENGVPCGCNRAWCATHVPVGLSGV